MGLLDDRVAVITGAGPRHRPRLRAHLRARRRQGRHQRRRRGARRRGARRLRGSSRRARRAIHVGSVADPLDTDALMKTAGRSLRQARHPGQQRRHHPRPHGAPDDRRVVGPGHRRQPERHLQLHPLGGAATCATSPRTRSRSTASPRYHRKIVNFFSTAAIRGNPGQINYTAAKMGNVGITRTVAQEWGRFWINVNAVAPGFTNTRLTAPKQKGDELGVPEEQRQAMLQRIPIGRFGEPEDIANAVLFFSSPLSDFVTGQDDQRLGRNADPVNCPHDRRRDAAPAAAPRRRRPAAPARASGPRPVHVRALRGRHRRRLRRRVTAVHAHCRRRGARARGPASRRRCGPRRRSSSIAPSRSRPRLRRRSRAPRAGRRSAISTTS